MRDEERYSWIAEWCPKKSRTWPAAQGKQASMSSWDGCRSPPPRRHGTTARRHTGAERVRPQPACEREGQVLRTESEEESERDEACLGDGDGAASTSGKPPLGGLPMTALTDDTWGSSLHHLVRGF